ncbi:unnamed protein product [Symbiodinium necroappetens]|uniref:Phosphoglycerate mutase n=1 Tax=Symbiodinium necroappetens TaxID=1628268 RepID=A0A812WWS5_9DINO|nr:unnamed protein product [Symbiodinium necroappetens]
MSAEEEDVPLVVVRSARELWWEDVANQPGPLESVYKRLEQLPRGQEVQALEAALSAKDAGTEAESIRLFRTVLAKRPEKTIAVVTHWGVINALCRQSADNCEMMECNCDGKGDLTFVRQLAQRSRRSACGLFLPRADSPSLAHFNAHGSLASAGIC